MAQQLEPSTATVGDATAECDVRDLGKKGAIATGVPFLDHMVDQLQSRGRAAATRGGRSVPALRRPF